MDNPRLGYLRQKANRLPLEPGVYIMRDKEGTVIYVGKAKALKNRVASYFRSVEKHLPKVYKMVEHVEDFSYIVTDSEFEALVLECSLIKKHNPKYNILLKDDKGYHYIQISPKRWSRITAAHNNKEEDAVYIGPFTSSFVVKQTVEEANQVFMLPTCNRRFPAERGKGRPCLNYYIKQCIGVCRGKITEEEYQEQVQQAVDFIKGGGVCAIERLTQLMEEAAENLDFEKAASLRDRIQAIQKLGEHQKVIYARVPEQDVIAIAKADGTACAAILKFRGERLVDKEDYLFPDVESVSDAMTHFISRYYTAGREIPRQISLHDESEEIQLLEQYLAKQAGRKVTVTVPKRGDQRKLAEMAYNNAAQRLSMESRRTTGREVAALDELARLLGLDTPPSYIEAYDISNIGSGTVVGGMIVFEDAKPKRSNYRRFSFERSAPDDYGCMREMLTRRFTRYLEEKDREPLTAFGRLPSLILLDGGKGHVAVVQEVLEQLGISVPVFGMVKDDRHRTRAIAKSGGEISIVDGKGAFNLVTTIQDEVHRFAITYSRSKHRKTAFESTLTQAEGIGPARAGALMRYFKTIKNMKAATVEELCQPEGMNRRAAEAVYEFLHQSPDGT